MSVTALRRMVLKDLHLLRWMSLGATAGGLAAAAMMTASPLPINVGGLLVICTFIVLNIFQAMSAAQERKEQVALFVLSLPISPSEYVTAKVAANLIAFLAPWLAVTAAVAAAVALSPIPDGYLPFWMAVQAYLFFYFCVLYAVALNTDSTGWHATVITAGNISVNLFIMILFTRPSVLAHGEGPAAVWTPDLTAVVVGGPLVGLATLALAIVAFSRRSTYL